MVIIRQGSEKIPGLEVEKGVSGRRHRCNTLVGIMSVAGSEKDETRVAEKILTGLKHNCLSSPFFPHVWLVAHIIGHKADVTSL